MQVSIIFDPAFDGETDEAVWIIDSPANRRWFERQHGPDVESALFSVGRYPDMDGAVVNMIWNAQEHHPAWWAITVIGVDLTATVARELREEGLLTETPDGFKLDRA
jgi:hypothetical protein